MTKIFEVGKVTLGGGRMPTQIKLSNGDLRYHREKDDLSPGDIAYRDDYGWKSLECGNCGIEPMEGDSKFICPECNAIFR